MEDEREKTQNNQLNAGGGFGAIFLDSNKWELTVMLDREDAAKHQCSSSGGVSLDMKAPTDEDYY